MNPISVETIAPIVRSSSTRPNWATGCKTNTPHDLKEEFARLLAWLIELAHRYGDALRIRLTDLQSFEGFFYSVRYWVLHPIAGEACA